MEVPQFLIGYDISIEIARSFSRQIWATAIKIGEEFRKENAICSPFRVAVYRQFNPFSMNFLCELAWLLGLTRGFCVKANQWWKFWTCNRTDMGLKRRKIDGSTLRNPSSAELTTISDILEWMLFEVLMRLPVKVLFKFKVVSKQWHSMISDPSFARMYVARTSLLSHSQNWTVIYCFADKTTSPTDKHFLVKKVPLHECSLGTNCLQHRLILPRAQQVDDLDYRIVGVSNGFVLYGPRKDVAQCGRIYSYYICNLITGQWITLPPHEHRFKYVITGFLTQVEDNILASYRVVCLDWHNRSGSVYRFVVYFSEIYKWMDFDIDFNEEISFHWWKNAPVLDKILHWIINGHRIMAYDPYNKPDSFRLISLPGVAFESYEGNEIEIDDILLEEHQGNLRYFTVAMDERLNEFSRILSIWVLNDYNCGEWCLQHTVSIGDNPCYGCLRLFTAPLSFHPFDQNIVYMVNREAFLSYNFKTRKLKIVDDSSKDYLTPLSFCQPYLFVVPPWPESINSSSFKVIED